MNEEEDLKELQPSSRKTLTQVKETLYSFFYDEAEEDPRDRQNLILINFYETPKKRVNARNRIKDLKEEEKRIENLWNPQYRVSLIDRESSTTWDLPGEPNKEYEQPLKEAREERNAIEQLLWFFGEGLYTPGKLPDGNLYKEVQKSGNSVNPDIKETKSKNKPYLNDARIYIRACVNYNKNLPSLSELQKESQHDPSTWSRLLKNKPFLISLCAELDKKINQSKKSENEEFWIQTKKAVEENLVPKALTGGKEKRIERIENIGNEPDEEDINDSGYKGVLNDTRNYQDRKTSTKQVRNEDK